MDVIRDTVSLIQQAFSRELRSVHGKTPFLSSQSHDPGLWCGMILGESDMSRKISGMVLVLSLMIATGCTPIRDQTGAQILQDRVERVVPKTSTRNDVLGLLGAPTIQGAFDDAVWYYISQKTKQVAFLSPKVTERSIIAVRFDGDGVVTSVDTLDETQARAINMENTTTPSAGRTPGVLQQIIGNVGKY